MDINTEVNAVKEKDLALQLLHNVHQLDSVCWIGSVHRV